MFHGIVAALRRANGVDGWGGVCGSFWGRTYLTRTGGKLFPLLRIGAFSIGAAGKRSSADRAPLPVEMTNASKDKFRYSETIRESMSSDGISPRSGGRSPLQIDGGERGQSQLEGKGPPQVMHRFGINASGVADV
jgi:hypothetical protein